MRAAVMRAYHAPLELEEISIDAPGPGEVLVRTAASGICHSDLHVVEAALPMPPPCILGHEPAGIVEAVGEGVIGFAPGDHVIGCMSMWCGTCEMCLRGKPRERPRSWASCRSASASTSTSPTSRSGRSTRQVF